MSTSQSRHVYTRDERLILEASFARQSHPNVEEKERLAKLFNCNIIQISNWFQNHRVSHLFATALFSYVSKFIFSSAESVNSENQNQQPL